MMNPVTGKPTFLLFLLGVLAISYHIKYRIKVQDFHLNVDSKRWIIFRNVFFLHTRTLTYMCGLHVKLLETGTVFWKCSWAHAVISITCLFLMQCCPRPLKMFYTVDNEIFKVFIFYTEKNYSEVFYHLYTVSFRFVKPLLIFAFERFCLFNSYQKIFWLWTPFMVRLMM